jgi:thiol-disulfide isomerase/thioredoxin
MTAGRTGAWCKAAGSANAINCYLDRDIDHLMSRTSRRSLPSGRVAPSHALIFGSILALLSCASLALLHPSDGQTTLALANVKGKPVVLNFWASWCAPCKEELPLLEQTWQQQQGQGTSLVFLRMDFQESSSDAATFLQHYRITYPIVLDTNGEAAQQYHVTALPQTIFINREGTVVWRISGELTAKTLSNGLSMIL